MSFVTADNHHDSPLQVHQVILFNVDRPALDLARLVELLSSFALLHKIVFAFLNEDEMQCFAEKRHAIREKFRTTIVMRYFYREEELWFEADTNTLQKTGINVQRHLMIPR